MRFKSILRRSEILHLPPLPGHVLMVAELLLTHTVEREAHTLSSPLQQLTCGTSSQEGNPLTDRERETHPTQQCQ